MFNAMVAIGKIDRAKEILASDVFKFNQEDINIIICEATRQSIEYIIEDLHFVGLVY